MNCYLCKNDSFVQIREKVRDRDDIKVLKCNNCGLVFLDSIEHISQDFYQEGGMGKSFDLENIAATTDFSDTEKRFDLHGNLFANKKVLDFGCGKGSLLKKIKESGITDKLYGLEPDETCRDLLKKDFTIFSSLDEIPDNYFDVISMFHVAEHLPNPLEVLEKLYKKLIPGGKIILEVPNSDDALLNLYGCESFAAFTYWSCHLYLFNASTLELLFKKTKYKINCIRQYQRYSLANHLYWLAENKPAGHIHWSFLEDDVMQTQYEKKLAAIGQCDTLIAVLEK